MSDDPPPSRPETGGAPPPPPYSGEEVRDHDHWVQAPRPGAPGSPPPPPPIGQPRRLPPPERRPDPVALRPRDVGGILDAAIRLYRSHWRGLMGIVAVLLVPSSFIVAAITATGSVVGTIGATILDYAVVTPVLTAAVVKASADVYLGDEVSVGGTYRFVWTKAGRLVGLVLLVVLLFVAPVGLIVAIGFADLVPVAIALGAVFVVLAVLFGVRWYFAATTIVLEDQGVTSSLRRSWRLTGGHFWKVLGTLALAGILVAIVSGIISIPFTLPTFFDALAGGDGSGVVPLFVQTVGGTIAAILTQPFTSLVGVLLYFDLRIRDEGFDLEVMARELRGA